LQLTYLFKLLGHDDIASHYNISNQIIVAACPLIFREVMEQVGIGDQKWKRWYSRIQRNLIFNLDRELSMQKTLLGFPSIPFNWKNIIKVFPIVNFQIKRVIRKFAKLLLNTDIFWDQKKYDKNLLMRHLISKKEVNILLKYNNMESNIFYDEESFNMFIGNTLKKGCDMHLLRTIFLFECCHAVHEQS
jgi:hypothetical protein